ncbi:nucleolar protein 12-domain-containing protein [Xylariales sp. PMI_506]|nr:nucleolar protein 12-domain-containing protein [Xylariales sp. PMI_506]
MFGRPRPKKSVLPFTSKKRKANHTIEEINFDDSSRAEYLTGFHKRKVQRVKRAQEEAVKREKQEKLETRKQIREERKREVEEHVQHVNALLREAERAGGVDSADEGEDDEADDGGEWSGLPDTPLEVPVDHEEEYIDEDKYTSVIIESVSVTRDGLQKPAEEPSEEEIKEKERRAAEARKAQEKADQSKKKKKKKNFTYETKLERQLTSRKQKIKKLKARS